MGEANIMSTIGTPGWNFKVCAEFEPAKVRVKKWRPEEGVWVLAVIEVNDLIVWLFSAESQNPETLF